ncbi:hypothetical protein PR202_ga22975 [Eleusine coracana subsp. coracana]|uniref:KIB1-4 beta-propeller domain-containing protein n=1 Tax=Eleusine coracana subsp. coracana TaxID=191504 RepID=A0AAV5D338_ELECO|nr:hypothetical protein PR202_ga22975 [Eleusine coracana subsp. coracana]
MGSSHGWLATADENSDLLLVNPATRAQFKLPPIRTLTFCKDYEDMMYNVEDGLFYAIRGNGEVHTIDLTTGPSPVVKVVFEATVPPPLDDCFKYIVRAPWGDILQVHLEDDYAEDTGVSTITKTVVYKMDFVEQKIIQTKNLHGYALFIGFNSPFFFFPNEDCSMIKQNCVYHADDLIALMIIYARYMRHVAWLKSTWKKGVSSVTCGLLQICGPIGHLQFGLHPNFLHEM